MAEMSEKEISIRPNVTIRERAFKGGDVILGRYRVQSELGRGGMGIVYLCRDLVANVDVAVKGLPPEVSHSSEEMENILRNYQLVRALRDENIAAVTNLELDAASKDYFLVMDYAAGISLKKWMQDHPGWACWRAKIGILRQIAKALDYAHRAQPCHIIHRDVKPSNIIIGDKNAVKVLDFGLAAQIRSSFSRVSMEVTSRSGTPSYKSPEQWLAQPQREASDQYSLGVIAYQMLAGVLPFDDENSSIMREAVVHDPVPKISELSGRVNGVLAKVLAKNASDRYESCVGFVEALDCAFKRGTDEGMEPSPQKTPQEFTLPQALASSASSERSDMDVILVDVPQSRLLNAKLKEAEIRVIQRLCKGYRTLLAESASLHQAHEDIRMANMLKHLQARVRDAAPTDEDQGSPNELIRIFATVGREHKKFLGRRLDYAYFMEHRRQALLFQKNRTETNAVTAALFGSIE